MAALPEIPEIDSKKQRNNKKKQINKKIFSMNSFIRHSRSFWDRVGYDHLVILLAVPR
jgi:hypothetical protein